MEKNPDWADIWVSMTEKERADFIQKAFDSVDTSRVTADIAIGMKAQALLDALERLPEQPKKAVPAKPSDVLNAGCIALFIAAVLLVMLI